MRIRSDNLCVFSCLMTWSILVFFALRVIEGGISSPLIPIGYLLGRWLGDGQPLIVELREVSYEFIRGNKIILFKIFGGKL